MNNATIAFIGAGNIARSLIGGLIADGYHPQKIWVSNPSKDKLKILKDQFSIHTTQNNEEAVKHAEIVVLAVKPNTLREVIESLADIIREKQCLLISVVAGIYQSDIQIWLKAKHPVVRCMPNTPALVGSGATAMFANELVSLAQKDKAESIMRAVGLIVWLDHESQLDIVTALSGCGPAYYFLLMEAFENAAKEMGLPESTSHLLTIQTVLGAAQMALKAEMSCAQLRENVTSPGGVTEVAIQLLEERGIRNLIRDVMQLARDRSIEIALEQRGESSL